MNVIFIALFLIGFATISFIMTRHTTHGSLSKRGFIQVLVATFSLFIITVVIIGVMNR